MAVSLYDAGANSNLGGGGGTSITASFSPASGGSGVVLVVYVATGLTKTFSTTDWDGQTLTELGSELDFSAGKLRSFYLSNPNRDGTSKTLTFSWSGTTRACVACAMYQDAGTPSLPTGSDDTGTGTSPSISVTTATGGYAVHGCGIIETGGRTVTPGSGETERHNPINSDIDVHFLDEATSATTSADYTFTSDTYAARVVEVPAAAVAGPNVRSMLTLGVGS